MVSVELPGRSLRLKVWRSEVGRAGVLLLDADVPENSPEDRQLTARLYGGDNRTRIVQELILGVGGMRALRVLGMHPEVCHLNEGHAAFCTLERVRELVTAGHSFGDAKVRVKETTVFTTHTPTPAGHDSFSPELFRRFLEGWPQALGTDDTGLWELGHQQEDWGPVFNMTVLAMTLSAGRNAVSRIHREVVAEMWKDSFDPDSIMYVTNGVHTWSWLSAPLAKLFDRHSGGRSWRRTPEDAAAWSFVDEIPADELWDTHTRIKRHTVEFLNRRLRTQRGRNGSSVPDIDPEALTIGFARRFATYKRATLLLHDVERIQKIAKDADRPVQFVFAGKAHPADTPGKEFIRELYRASQNELRGHLFVLEDYDMSLTRRMVRGVDLWMNNPRPPLEASGTSGQKAAMNGIPNLSVLDGWWPEAYNGDNGWTMGSEKEYPASDDQDAADAASLYDTLEESIVPLFYDRDEAGVPQGWVGVMKESVSTVAPAFSAQRMVRDYVHRLYVPRMVSPGC
jgi:starch phosphorylase